MINLTATERRRTRLPDPRGLRAPHRRPHDTSALTFAAGDTMAVDGGRAGRQRRHDSVSTGRRDVHSIVDVVGYLGGDGEPLWFDPSVPTRLTDTRTDRQLPPVPGMRGRAGPDGSVHAVPDGATSPTLANIAVVDGQRPRVPPGRAHATASATTQTFSNLNYVRRRRRANMALIDGGDDRQLRLRATETHVIVDELGALDPDERLGWKIDAATARPRHT